MTAKEREKWLSLQEAMPLGSTGDLDIAFLLAREGVDYDRNITTLMHGSGRGDPSVHAPSIRVPYACSDDGCWHKAGHVARLYHRLRDPTLLEWLLDPSPLAETDRQARTAALLELWDAHWLGMLYAAAENPDRCTRIADMLLFALRRHAGSADLWTPYVCQLNEAANGDVPELKSASLALLRQLRSSGVPVDAAPSIATDDPLPDRLPNAVYTDPLPALKESAEKRPRARLRTHRYRW